MSEFKNISGEDREVQIDGNRIFVEDGKTFKVADAHDGSLVEQPFFQIVKSTKPEPVAATTEGEI